MPLKTSKDLVWSEANTTLMLIKLVDTIAKNPGLVTKEGFKLVIWEKTADKMVEATKNDVWSGKGGAIQQKFNKDLKFLTIEKKEQEVLVAAEPKEKRKADEAGATDTKAAKKVKVKEEPVEEAPAQETNDGGVEGTKDAGANSAGGVELEDEDYFK